MKSHDYLSVGDRAICAAKVPYACAREALDTTRRLRRRRRKLKVYECLCCGQWHLTKTLPQGRPAPRFLDAEQEEF